MSLLRQPILMLARSERVKSLVSAMPVSSGIVASYVPGETTDDAVDGDVRARRRRAARDARLPRRGHPRRGAGRRHGRGLPRAARQSSRPRGLARHGRGVGEARRRSARRCPRAPASAEATRSPSRTPATICRAARNAGTTVTLDMEDHTTTDSTLRDPARAAQGLPRDRCGAAGLPAPHRGRLPRRWPTRGRGCGCARAPTTSPRRSPSRTGTRSTSPTSAASRC